VLVSAFAFGGAPELAISAVLRAAQPFVTEELLDEYRGVAPRLFAEGKMGKSSSSRL
jgi:hypothetical protein